ncbi:aldo/keto reductase [Isoptericola sp. NPDC057191]|uniref:aldo/keto reductase n=1 Tax=Isoptericola sp. NPDC057191 TaxID=3346041 RepID=UPI003639E4A4
MMSSTDHTPGGRGALAGHSVARVGYGAMQLQRLRGDRDAAERVVRRAVELGVDHVDTAPFYGRGFVDVVLRDVLRPEDGVTVVSKVGAEAAPAGAPFPVRVAQRPEQLRAGVEASLRGLGVERIDVVNLRRMDTPQRVPVPADQVVDLDDQLAVMLAMRDEGMIGAIGLSCVTPEVLRRALSVGVACVQNPYSVVAREDEELLRMCEEAEIPWVPFFPLGGGFPGAAKAGDAPVVRAVADELGITTSQVALAWLLHHSPRTLLIPGTADVDHLEANLVAGAVDLDTETLHRLDAVGSRTAGND